MQSIGRISMKRKLLQSSKQCEIQSCFIPLLRSD